MKKKAPEAKFNRFTDFLLQTLVKRKAKNKGIYRFVDDTIKILYKSFFL